MTPLDVDVHRAAPPADDQAVAILLHGRGSHKGDLAAFRPLLPAEWVLVTPQAPHPGGPWGYGPGWAWYRYVAEDRVVAETLEESLGALDRLVHDLPDLLGTRPGPVVLGGFSQGGTTSLAWALRHPGRVAAVLNFSGFLADGVELPADGGSAATPVFWGHGTGDPAIPHALALRGRARLAEAGVALEARDYPIGHWIDPSELRDAVSFAAARTD